MKKIVAFIDDDNGPIIYYEMALNDSGFDVIRLRTFVKALNFIQDPQNRPDLWIVDTMMSIEDSALIVDGEPVIETTNMGLAAGLLLYKKIKERDADTPVIMLTSISTPGILDSIESSLFGDDTCEAKLDMLPQDLASKVQQLLKP